MALPFERLFGLAANALDPSAVARVAALKSRPEHRVGPRPIAVILPELEALERVAADVSPLAKQLARAHWPGLLTLVLNWD